MLTYDWTKNGGQVDHEDSGEVDQQGTAFPEAIPIEKGHKTKEITKELKPVDSGTRREDCYFDPGCYYFELASQGGPEGTTGKLQVRVFSSEFS